jgi:hypothetical protein
MATAKAEKCAHPVCSCVTTSGKYCSTQCEAMERRRTSIVRADTPAARVKRPNKKLVQHLLNEPSIKNLNPSSSTTVAWICAVIYTWRTEF